MKNEKDIVRQIGDLIAEYKHGRLALACEVEKLVKKLIEDNKRAHTHELEELDREWRKKVAGLRMEEMTEYDNDDPMPNDTKYVRGYNKAADKLNEKINQLLEEHE